ncbi:MAG: cyclase family protein [Euryarchaeota archaeon]|nr:cyclase family protein [Euryarchaeota archaeon]
MTLDITRRLDLGFPVWPGDPAYERVPHLETEPYVAVSRLVMSTHTGTHVDAPLHFVPGGTAVDALELDRFWGPCLVIDLREEVADLASDDGALLLRGGHLSTACRRAGLPPETWKKAERLLLRTDTVRDIAGVPERTPGVSPTLAKTLSGGPLRLIGIDTPSVDARTGTVDEDHPAHRTLLGAGRAFLEWLDLAGVATGHYEISALPLRLAGADGSPVRAALRPLTA